MINRKIMLITILTLTLILSGCMFTNWNGGVAHGSFTNPKTDTLTEYIDIKKGTRNLNIDLEVKAKKGKINLILKDPSGEEIINEIIKDKKHNAGIDVESPKVGRWEIVTILDKAVGEYRYKSKYK